jgi:hypothetical protein
MIPGEIVAATGSVTLNDQREQITVVCRRQCRSALRSRRGRRHADGPARGEFGAL